MRKDLHGKAGLMKAVAVGGLWPEQMNAVVVSVHDAWLQGSRLRRLCDTRLLQDARLDASKVDSSGKQRNHAVYQSNMLWKPDVYFSDGSGGSHCQDP